MTEEGIRKRQMNGDVGYGYRAEEGSRENSPEYEHQSVVQREISLQVLRDKALKAKSDLVESFDGQLQELLDNFLSDISLLQVNGGQRRRVASERDKRKKGKLPDKCFVARNSVLTELLEISHIRTIYHIFVAILIVFSLNTIIYDFVTQGRLVLDFDIIQWAFAKFPIVLWVWVCMKLASILVVYPAFYFWANQRSPGPADWFDWTMLGLYVCYQCAFLTWPIQEINATALPPASSVVIICEQVRLMMKSHAFIRSNIPRAMGTAKRDEDSDEESELVDGGKCPGFSKYLYFLFAPTLVYRDHYPRTPVIHWYYVFSNFVQVLASLFYIYYIFERFCVPVFRDFSHEYMEPQKFVLSVFSSVLPGTLVLFIGFFAILHSWLNAFAEMLRFADRLFYKDWWNATSFASYYRTWNVVVHDWLYSYVYRDCCQLMGTHRKPLAMGSVFLLSAVFHEYILTVTFGFFYPVLFLMFQGAGFAFIFLPSKSRRSGNVFMWVALFIGNGMLMCLYSMEWFARQRCPYSSDDPLVDKLIPRSWFCHIHTADLPSAQPVNA